MKLFTKRSARSLFGEFDTRMKSRRLQQEVLRTNLHPKRTAFRALIAKSGGPQFKADISARQSFADFKLAGDAAVRKGGLARFFQRPKSYSKGDSK